MNPPRSKKIRAYRRKSAENPRYFVKVFWGYISGPAYVISAGSFFVLSSPANSPQFRSMIRQIAIGIGQALLAVVMVAMLTLAFLFNLARNVVLWAITGK